MNVDRMKEILIKRALSSYISEDEILGIYDYGSTLYCTSNSESDLDLCIVLKDTSRIFSTKEKYFQDESEDLDFHFMSASHYKFLLEKCDIMALEMYYQPYPIIKYNVDFTLNKQELRKSISKASSLSWVKAKKKMTLEKEDSYIGFKSLFHSFRILYFGIQIARDNALNFHSMVLWQSLLDDWQTNKEWQFYFDKYKKEHNKLSSEFREYTPKH